MTNERVWEARVRPMDDDGTAAEFGWGTEVQLLDRGELHVTVSNLTPESSAALAAQVNAPAAPSEGDGRREVPLMTGHAVWQAISAGQRVEWRHPEGHWTDVLPEEWEKHADSLASVVARIADPAASSPAPLPPGVHRAPTGELLCKGGALLSLPSGWQFRNMSGASWTLCSKFGSPSYNHSFFAVRPVPPVPEPERVHYLEAVGRLVPGEDEPIQVAVGWGVSVRADAAIHVVQADADGLVSVLPLGDPK